MEEHSSGIKNFPSVIDQTALNIRKMNLKFYLTPYVNTNDKLIMKCERKNTLLEDNIKTVYS